MAYQGRRFGSFLFRLFELDPIQLVWMGSNSNSRTIHRRPWKAIVRVLKERLVLQRP